MPTHLISVDTDQCIGCALCQRDCPADNIIIADKKAAIKSQSCIKCGHCAAVCPKAAIRISGFDELPIELDKVTRVDSSQLLAALQSRRSIRQFTDQQVESEIVNRIIEAGRLTPTAKNAQDVSYIVLSKEKAHCEKIAVNFFKKLQPWVGLFSSLVKNFTFDDNFFFKKAPLAILVLSNNKINASLAASNMALMAEANGLGVLYSGFFAFAANYSPALRKALSLSKHKVVTVLVLGYPNVRYYRTAQRSDAVVRYL